jgi:DNA-binding XRE family transcriptional regulator
LEENCLDIAKTFGEVLRDMRIEAGMTQEQLGLEADLRRTFISLLELGQQQPTLTTLIKLAHALRCPAHEIVAKFEASAQALK